MKGSPTSTDTDLSFTCGVTCKLPTLSLTVPSSTPLSSSASLSSPYSSSSWAFIFANVGFNRIFHWNFQTRQISDITPVFPPYPASASASTSNSATSVPSATQNSQPYEGNSDPLICYGKIGSTIDENGNLDLRYRNELIFSTFILLR